jgi:hypothetical protein
MWMLQETRQTAKLSCDFVNGNFMSVRLILTVCFEKGRSPQVSLLNFNSCSSHGLPAQ